MGGHSIIIYGAYGYTGRLIAQRAAAEGLPVLLSGRNGGPLSAVAAETGLPYRACALDDDAGLDSLLKGASAVIHAAGPFIHTARPMLAACLRNRVHYTDITGEIEVFALAQSLDAQAKERGVMLMPGTGFDIVPSDCLALRLKEMLPGAVRLRLAFSSTGGVSRGTALTAVENLGRGGAIRSGGRIMPVPDAYDTRVFRFGGKERPAVTIPWGDVFTAYFTTGIPDISVYMSLPPSAIRAMRAMRMLGPLMRTGLVRNLLRKRIMAGKPGPDEAALQKGRVFLTGEAEDAGGHAVRCSLTTPDGYALTAAASLAIAKRIAEGQHQAGFATPAMVYGSGFILSFCEQGWADG